MFNEVEYDHMMRRLKDRHDFYADKVTDLNRRYVVLWEFRSVTGLKDALHELKTQLDDAKAKQDKYSDEIYTLQQMRVIFGDGLNKL